jgi:hypothetical protein
MRVESSVLLDATFGTEVLREWAVRVHHRYGHSNTRHQMYKETCAALVVIPYIEEDFINYGELNLHKATGLV